MIGAEEFFRYDPSRSNDKVLSQLQRFRDQEAENLRLQGDRQAMATRETMQNIAKIPESIADSYLQGTEENRRQRQQDMLEGQEARQKELHPLDIESRKSTLERNKFGLSEEEKLSKDVQRERDWKTKKRADSDLTNEQYAYELQQKGLEQGLAGQRTQQGLAGAQLQNLNEQTKTAKEDRAVKMATAQYKLAYQSGDPQSIAAVDAKLSNLDPGLIQLAKNDAQAAIKGAQMTQNLEWQSGPQGQKTMAQLQAVQDKASTISQVKAYISQYNSAGYETDQANQLKANIVALLSKPEMGPEGQHAAELVKGGVLGVRLDPSGFSNTKQRLDSSLQNIEAGIAADLSQINTQNKGVTAPAYQNAYQNTVASFQQARNTSTKANVPNLFGNPTPQNPGAGAMQQVNTAPPALGPNPPNKQQLQAPAPASRFLHLKNKGGTP